MHKSLLHYSLILGSLLVYSNTLATSINFQNSKLYKEIVSQAQTEQKDFFVYFSATWCAPCQIISRTAFKDENVTDFVNQNMIAVKVDIDDASGKIWQSEFGVQSLPTMIFFNKDGIEIRRITSGVSGSKLFGILQSLDGSQPFYSANSITSFTPYRIIGDNEFINNSTVAISNSGVFEVQVGKFAKEKDIQRQLGLLSDNFERHQFYILREKLMETTVFTLVLSGFKNRHEAQQAKGILSNKNYDARLIQL